MRVNWKQFVSGKRFVSSEEGEKLFSQPSGLALPRHNIDDEETPKRPNELE